jgi:hypothetical protein
MMPFRVFALAAFASLFVLSALLPARASAQGAKIPVYRLDVRKVEDIPNGKAALVAGEAGPTPHRFFVENLHMLIPVSVTLRATNREDRVNLKIHKGNWDTALREDSTADGRAVNFKFRTHGEFQVSVESPTPGAKYKMVVWLGPDIQPRSEPIIVPTSQFDSRSGASQWWWLGGGLVLLLVVGGLAVFFRRRRVS